MRSLSQIQHKQLSDNIISGPQDAYKILIYLKQKLNIFNAPIRNVVHDKGLDPVYVSMLRMVLGSVEEFKELTSKVEQALKNLGWVKTGASWTRPKTSYLSLTMGPMVFADQGIRFSIDVVGTAHHTIRVRQVQVPNLPKEETSIIQLNKIRIKMKIPQDFNDLPFVQKVETLMKAAR
jgi:hypothetical protein